MPVFGLEPPSPPIEPGDIPTAPPQIGESPEEPIYVRGVYEFKANEFDKGEFVFTPGEFEEREFVFIPGQFEEGQFVFDPGEFDEGAFVFIRGEFTYDEFEFEGEAFIYGDFAFEPGQFIPGMFNPDTGEFIPGTFNFQTNEFVPGTFVRSEPGEPVVIGGGSAEPEDQPTVVVEDEPAPLEQAPEPVVYEPTVEEASTPEVVDMLEAEVPLAALEEGYYENEAPPEIEMVLMEEDVPLSMMPQTGLADISSVLTSGFILSALIMAVISHKIRLLKRKADAESVLEAD